MLFRSAGALLIVCLRETHLDPRLYPSPFAFDHTRWLGRSPPRYGYLPFARGPHYCLGSMLAGLELRVFLPALVKGYRFRLATPSFTADIIRGGHLQVVREPLDDAGERAAAE